jgi:ABC-type uncharacterized transport system involved in gliding motility auxiliary subunit
MELLAYLVAMFLLPFLGVVFGDLFVRWLRRRRRPRVMDSDWRGL